LCHQSQCNERRSAFDRGSDYRSKRSFLIISLRGAKEKLAESSSHQERINELGLDRKNKQGEEANQRFRASLPPLYLSLVCQPYPCEEYGRREKATYLIHMGCSLK
jgi:hypothetical protein